MAEEKKEAQKEEKFAVKVSDMEEPMKAKSIPVSLCANVDYNQLLPERQ